MGAMIMRPVASSTSMSTYSPTVDVQLVQLARGDRHDAAVPVTPNLDHGHRRILSRGYRPHELRISTTSGELVKDYGREAGPFW